MEINGLKYLGQGQLTDKETNKNSKITMNVDIDFCQIVMKFEANMQDGNVYPMIEIKDVGFTLFQDTWDIKSDGDIPAY